MILEDIPVTVTAPDKINVTMVREDYIEQSGEFRTGFEIFLGVSCTFLGLALDKFADKSATSAWPWWAGFLLFSGLAGYCMRRSIKIREKARLG